MKLIKCLQCGNDDVEKFGNGKVRTDNTREVDFPPSIEIDYWRHCGRSTEIFAHVCGVCGFVMLFDETKLQ